MRHPDVQIHILFSILQSEYLHIPTMPSDFLMFGLHAVFNEVPCYLIGTPTRTPTEIIKFSSSDVPTEVIIMLSPGVY